MTFFKSLSRFEIDMCGCNKKSNAASFYVCFAMVIPLISGMDLILFSRGSRVRTNNNVERGHPFLVPLWTLKASDR